MNEGKLLSIILPTRNRQEYAYHMISIFTEFKNKNIQLIVQDNSDDNRLEDLISNDIKDSRIHYNYTEGKVSFVENFNIAIDLSEGEYVTIIGDDDCTLIEIVDIAKLASEKKIDAVKFGLNAVYFWPESGALKKGLDNGQLFLRAESYSVLECDPKDEVLRFLRSGGENYLSYNLVKLYHGLVKRELLEKIKLKTGHYIGGLSPDIYISIALSLEAKSVLVLNFPFTVSGICKGSGSSNSATGKHTGKIEDAPHFYGRDKYVWSKYVPKFYSVETIWADSALSALSDLKRKDLLKEFNIKKNAILCARKHREFSGLIREHMISSLNKNYSRNTFRFEIQFSKLEHFIKRVYSKIFKYSSKVSKHSHVSNIDEAVKLINNKKFDLKKILCAIKKHTEE